MSLASMCPMCPTFSKINTSECLGNDACAIAISKEILGSCFPIMNKIGAFNVFSNSIFEVRVAIPFCAKIKPSAFESRAESCKSFIS